MISISDPESSAAAHYYLGHTYESAFNAIKSLPHSGKLSDADMLAAVNLREALILQVRTSMENQWEQGLKVAQTGKRHDYWVRQIRAKLAQYSPRKYLDNSEIILRPIYTSHAIFSNAKEEKP